MVNHVLFNPGPAPVIYDTAGHAVDALDRVTTSPNTAVVRAMVAAGSLLDQGPADDPAAEPETVEVVVDDDAPNDNDESGD